ncbi:hypothetical protein BRAS3809_7300015 [Bradyrhizobium sp. STM 3809]|nr:hypothetical protein BRAS3809_7300015 [Bradyrhizobium sp. STM 3809]
MKRLIATDAEAMGLRAWGHAAPIATISNLWVISNVIHAFRTISRTSCRSPAHIDPAGDRRWR